MVVTFESNDGTDEEAEATADIILELLSIRVFTIPGDELLLGVMLVPWADARADKLTATELSVRRMLFVSVEFTIMKALLRLREGYVAISVSDCFALWPVERFCRSEG